MEKLGLAQKFIDLYVKQYMNKIKVNVVQNCKEIAGFPDYFVYRDGRIRSDKRRESRFLKPGKDKDGYHYVILYSDGKKTFKRVHRLVAEAFIPNPDNKPCVDHKDRDRTNNAVENLAWVTSAENDQNRDARGYHFDKRRGKWVVRIKVNGEEFSSCVDTEEEARAARLAAKREKHKYWAENIEIIKNA